MRGRGVESYQGELIQREQRLTLRGGAAGSRLHKADTATCIVETSRRQGAWTRTCKPTREDGANVEMGDARLDLGENAKGSVNPGKTALVRSSMHLLTRPDREAWNPLLCG